MSIKASASASRVLFRTAQRLRSRHGTRGWGWYHRTLAEREIKPLGPHALHYKALSAEHVRPQVYFDIESADKTYGRMVFELADDIVPKTVENFVKLCTGTGDNGYTLKGTALHLLAKDRFLAGGRVLDVNKHTGHASGASMYFEDENFILGHGERGFLSMANSGVDRNSSHFFVTLSPQPQLDGRNVSFGRMVEGQSLLDDIEENVFTVEGSPSPDLVITDAGVL